MGSLLRKATRTSAPGTVHTMRHAKMSMQLSGVSRVATHRPHPRTSGSKRGKLF